MQAIQSFLADVYPWTKSLHIMSVISWMAGLFYLPRLYVHHAERAAAGSELSETFKMMESKLLRLIMNPAMIATWLFGLCLVFTPGIVDWSEGWAHVKAAMVIGMTWFHHSLAQWRKTFERDENSRDGRFYRLWNEAPTVMMIIIVVMVVVKPF